MYLIRTNLKLKFTHHCIIEDELPVDFVCKEIPIAGQEIQIKIPEFGIVKLKITKIENNDTVFVKLCGLIHTGKKIKAINNTIRYYHRYNQMLPHIRGVCYCNL